MAEAASYLAVEHLRDGRPIEIRALRPNDRDEMLVAFGRTSTQSIQRRFFSPKKGFSEKEMAFFLNIDFEGHVASLHKSMKTDTTTRSSAGDAISLFGPERPRWLAPWSMRIKA